MEKFKKISANLISLFSNYSPKDILIILRIIRKNVKEIKAKEWTLEFEEILIESFQTTDQGLYLISENPSFKLQGMNLIQFFYEKDDLMKELKMIESSMVDTLEPEKINDFKKALNFLVFLKKEFK